MNEKDSPRPIYRKARAKMPWDATPGITEILNGIVLIALAVGRLIVLSFVAGTVIPLLQTNEEAGSRSRSYRFHDFD